MRVACLVSGGKDSLYACYLAMQKGWDVRYLIGVVPENPDSWMFQSVSEEHFRRLSDVTGVQIIIQKTKGEAEKELEDLRTAISKVRNEVDAVISGAVLSDYQKHRIDMICEELSIRSFAPLWRKDGEMLLADVLDAGFKAEVVRVSAEGLDESFVGQVIDEELFRILKALRQRYGVHIMGEGGEYDTLVRDAPIFKKPI